MIKKFLFAVVMIVGLSVVSNAQDKFVWLGGSADAASKPNPAGHGCFGIGSEGSGTYSLSCASIRKGSTTAVINELTTGAAQKLASFKTVDIYGVGEAGISTTVGATNGLFDGGFAATVKIKNLRVVFLAKVATSGDFEGVTPRFGAGIVFKP